MNSLRECLHEYLAMRRALGFRLKKDERLLLEFAAFMERRRAKRITVKLSIKWAQRTGSTDRNYHAGRLRAIRSFARYRILIDPHTEIPSADILPRQRRVFHPHLYSEDEIRRLLAATLQRRRSATSISRWARFTLFGLLSVTGLRVSEALNLDLEDVDLDQGILTIRNSKFGKSRLVPVHPSTRAALVDYLRRRNEYFADRPIVPFFVSRHGTRMGYRALHDTFLILLRKLGLRKPSDRQGPRLHDLRHSMAVEVLRRCGRSGADPERRLPALATYLGHTNLSHTYWYLHQNPSLMKQAMTRLEGRWEDSP
jgi:integrase